MAEIRFLLIPLISRNSIVIIVFPEAFCNFSGRDDIRLPGEGKLIPNDIGWIS